MTQREKHTKVKVLKDAFLHDVSCLLEPSNPKGRAFLNYLQRTGKQLNIKNLDPHELISDATMRGLTYIDDNSKRIDNTQAWLRKVCTYIMLDMVKGEKKNRLLKEKNKSSDQETDPLDKADSDEQKEMLKQVLSFLSKEDQQILDLKFYQGLSYKEIQQFYLDSLGKSIQIPALRQRESRALQRLRKQFLEKYGGNVYV
jgi:RNA polymerase sigma factor (sigma-70 family)